MATKSMTIRYTLFFKILMMVLTVAGMLAIGNGLLYVEHFESALSGAPYSESRESISGYRQVIQQIEVLLNHYRNEDFVNSGGTLTLERIASEKEWIRQEEADAFSSVAALYNPLIAEAKSANNVIEASRLETEKRTRLEAAEKRATDALSQVESKLIAEELKAFKDQREALLSTKGYVFSVENVYGDVVQSEAVKGDLEVYFNDFQSLWVLAQNGIEGKVDSQTIYRNSDGGFMLTGYIAETPEWYAYRASAYIYDRDLGRMGIAVITIGLLAVLVSVGAFIAVVGRTNKSTDVVLDAWDKPYLDVMAFIVSGGILGLMLLIVQFYDRVYPYDFYGFCYFAAAFITTGTLMGYYWLRLFVKRIKRGEVFRHTLIFKIFDFFFGKSVRRMRDLVEAVRSGPTTRRLVLEGLAYTLGLAFTIVAAPFLINLFGFFGLMMAFALFVSVSLYAFQYRYRHVSTLERIKAGVVKMAAGDLTYRIATDGFDTEQLRFAASIHAIAEGFHIAVDKAVKSERMKTELVTNVSHDLKTPLTSLIAYVDLLKQSGLNSDKAPEYLEVIDQKVERLRILIEDLFEAAKASSGTLQMQDEVMDFAELLTQGLGEISDEITASGLDLRIQVSEKPLYIRADGKFLWRILENLVSNVLKYSLPHSRVYIHLQGNEQAVIFTIKNISVHELSMPASELTERFKRGDEARHSEGSGLGLSIAKSLTELMRGTFTIEVDGDLFKVNLVFPREMKVALPRNEVVSEASTED